MYDQFRRDVLVYHEKVQLTAPNFMSYIAEGIQAAERACQIITATKSLAPAGSPKTYDIGRDVLKIEMLLTPEGHEIQSSGVTQHQRVREESVIGFNEETFNFSRRRGSVVDELVDSSSWFDGEALIYQRYANKIRLYPEVNSSASLKLYYVVDSPEFSSSETYWQNFFSTNQLFQLQFNTTTPLDIEQQLIRPAQEYAKFKWYEAMSLSTAETSRMQFHFQRFTGLCQEVIDNKQDHNYHNTPPANISPYSY